MPRVKKTSVEPAAGAEEFDVSSVPVLPVEPPTLDEVGDADDAEAEPVQPLVPQPETPVIETPEQRRLMRAKRIAKAEEEQLRRLMRQYPVVARLVTENEQYRQASKPAK